MGGERSNPQPLFCGVLQDLVLSPVLFNSYMKLLDEIIRHREMKYHQCADSIDLYISIPGEVRDAVDILSRFLETVKV